MKVLVLSDTHVRRLEDIPAGILKAVPQVDLVVHCGDFVRPEVLEGLRRLARRFVGVYGNTDPREVRQELPAQKVLELDGKKLAITHPAYGGPPFGLEEELVQEFPGVDGILFGHTHEPQKAWQGQVLLFNPGQAYNSFHAPASYGLLSLDSGGLEAEIVFLGEGEK